MRILPNRHDRAKLNQQLMALKDEVWQSQVSLVLDQPVELIKNWMGSIANNPDEMSLISRKHVLPIVVKERDDAGFLQPEPSMGTICVFSVPPIDTPDWDAFVETVFYQRVCDYYGQGWMDSLVEQAQIVLYGEPQPEVVRPLFTAYTDDPETPFVIVVRWPTVDQYNDEVLFRDYITWIFQNVFLEIATIEQTGYGKCIPPRRLPIQEVKFGKKAEVHEGRGYGYDAEIMLNGVVGHVINDKMQAEEFWKAFIQYLQERPEDMSVLRGLKPAPVAESAPEAANDA